MRNERAAAHTARPGGRGMRAELGGMRAGQRGGSLSYTHLQCFATLEIITLLPRPYTSHGFR